MPLEKRVVEEALAKAKSRQAKVRKLMDVPAPQQTQLEPYHDLILEDLEAASIPLPKIRACFKVRQRSTLGPWGCIQPLKDPIRTRARSKPRLSGDPDLGAARAGWPS